jgi:hypothetical protein
MRTRTTRDVPARLEGLSRRFERWRRTRQGHARIPESLWASAVKAAGKHGLNRTVRVLRLDYNSLKRRMEAFGSGQASEQGSIATFVEMAPPVSGNSRECTLELENPGGSKMRVHLKGAEGPDLAALSRSFWGIDTDERCPRPSSRKPTGRRRP